MKQTIVKINTSQYLSFSEQIDEQHKLDSYLNDGWLIKIATPIIFNNSTREIQYVLEREEE